MTGTLSRQSFLRGTALLAAGAVLGGCRRTPPVASATPPTTVPPQDWKALADAIEGRVVVPSDDDFGSAKALFNSRFDGSTPAAVVTPMSTDDVRHAMAFASRNGVKVSVRAGGHSYIGDSAAADTMVIDLRQLGGDTTFDSASGLATISAAAPLHSVQTALNAHGRSIPTGSCPTVGAAGLTLGGGLGADARGRGLTCDVVVSATVVLPSGDVVVASADEHDDLYWGLRGGGGGHFGVVTSFTFRTFGTVDRDVATLVFGEDVAAQAIVGWRDWVSDADPTIWSMVNLTASDSGLRCSIVAATSAGSGPTAAADVIAAVGALPVHQNVRTLNHPAFVDYFSGGDEATRPRTVVAGSDIVAEITRPAADSIVTAMTARPQKLRSATVVLESLTGAIRDIDSGGTAFPWRRQDACLQWYTEPGPDAVHAATNWLAYAHQTLGTNSVGAYVNYAEPDVNAARYFGDNLDRLKAVRARYDPDTLMYSTVSY